MFQTTNQLIYINIMNGLVPHTSASLLKKPLVPTIIVPLSCPRISPSPLFKHVTWSREPSPLGDKSGVVKVAKGIPGISLDVWNGFCDQLGMWGMWGIPSYPHPLWKKITGCGCRWRFWYTDGLVTRIRIRFLHGIQLVVHATGQNCGSSTPPFSLYAGALFGSKLWHFTEAWHILF